MLSDLKYRLRAIFRRAAMERELAAELELHHEREVAKLVARGLTASEAQRQARLAFGGAEQIKEATRGLRIRSGSEEPATADSIRQAMYSSSREKPLLHSKHAGKTGRFAGSGASRKTRDGTWSRVSSEPPQYTQPFNSLSSA